MSKRCPDCGDPFPRPWVTDDECQGLAVWRCWTCGLIYWDEN